MSITDNEIQVIWTAAMTAAANIVVSRNNYMNEKDASIDVLDEHDELIRQIKAFSIPDQFIVYDLRSMIEPPPSDDGDES